jgi:hypothetical protein
MVILIFNYKIDCETNSLDSQHFAGPLYSIYEVNCPLNCDKSEIVLI